jgi:superfamily II DNA or RNA helicase
MDIIFRHVDQTYIEVDASYPILQEIKDEFSFHPNGYQFDKRYKAGIWNGKISMLNLKTKQIYKGLLPRLITFAEHSNYDFEIDDEIYEGVGDYEIEIDKVDGLYERLGGPYTPRPSQREAVRHCVNEGRAIILAPTSNGKSYIMFGLCGFHAAQKQKTLIIIDRGQLVKQLSSNIANEYNGSKRFVTTTVYDDLPVSKCDVFVTTWQSIVDYEDEWFKQFDVIMGDEVHKFKAKSLQTIISKCGHIGTRYGFTATLDNDSKVDRLTLVGMFGEPKRVSTNKEQIEEGVASKPTVHAIILRYSDSDRKHVSGTRFDPKIKKNRWGMEFQDEVVFFAEHEQRNVFLTKLVTKLKGNSLTVFRREEHGRALHELFTNSAPEECEGIFFASGTVSLNKRVAIAEKIDTLKNSIGVVSLMTFGTGISINNINHIVIAAQIKSAIDIPQLIGRGLRMDKKTGKDTVDVWDIGDDCKYKDRENATWRHFQKRLEVYANEGFDIVFHEYKLKGA